MSAVVGDILPLAVAVAISPLPVIAVILILLSRRSRSNGLAFLLGWILGLAIAEGIVLVLVGFLSLSPGSGPTAIVAVLKLLLGGLLLYLGIRQWRHRLTSGQEPSIPRWMASIDSFTPAQAPGLAALLSSVGNLALILAVGLGIARAQLGVGQEVGVVAICIVIGSLTVAATVIYPLIAHDQASRTLTSWKARLLANHAALTSAVCVVVGALLVGQGMSGLGLLG